MDRSAMATWKLVSRIFFTSAKCQATNSHYGSTCSIHFFNSFYCFNSILNYNDFWDRLETWSLWGGSIYNGSFDWDSSFGATIYTFHISFMAKYQNKKIYYRIHSMCLLLSPCHGGMVFIYFKYMGWLNSIIIYDAIKQFKKIPLPWTNSYSISWLAEFKSSKPRWICVIDERLTNLLNNL